MNTKRRICVITGSRSDYGIMSNFLRKLQSTKDLELKLIVTCMHLIPKYGNSYKEILREEIIRLNNNCEKLDKDDLINKIKKTSNYDIPYFVAKNQKAMDFLKWRPKTNIRDTIIKTYNWINLNKKLIKKYYNE